MASFAELFETADLTPHGVCLLWRPELLWLHVFSDSAIGLAYYSIPLALAYFVWRRQDLAFGWIFGLFAAFILACGTTHWFEVWTLWHPDYGAQGVLKAATAAVSVITALLLWPLIPQALALPSPAALRRANDALAAEVAERNRAMALLEEEMVGHRQTEEVLHQAQKMEAVGQLTGGIAHDFNNLLTVIIGNIDIVQGGIEGAPPAARDAAATAMRGAMRAATLVRRLLAFSRQQPLEPALVDVARLIDGMGDLIHRAIGERIAYKVELAPDLPAAFCDAHQLESALLNLVLNARDAMPTRGRLVIAAAAARVTAGEKPGLENGEYLMLSVADDGLGMTEEVRRRAFEPFFTTKEAGKGSGLGLSMVYGFIKQSGGHIEIASRPGAGTEIRLYLPCRAAAAPTGAAARTVAGAAVSGL